MNLNNANLSLEEQDLAISAIRGYGTGRHGLPVRSTIGWFRVPYVIECLDRAVKASAECHMGSVIEKRRRARALIKKLSKLL